MSCAPDRESMGLLEWLSTGLLVLIWSGLVWLVIWAGLRR